MLVENYFETVNNFLTAKASNKSASQCKLCELVPLVVIDNVLNKLSTDIDVLPIEKKDDLIRGPGVRLTFKTTAILITKILKSRHKHLFQKDVRTIKNSSKFKETILKLEMASLKLEPKVEGRIIRIDDEKVKLKNKANILIF